MVKALLPVLAAALAAAGAATAADFQPIVSGLDNPVYVTSAPNDPSTLYVVERGGTIRTVANGGVTGTLLDLRSSVWSGGEGGLLSVAFSPAFAQNHLFYVDYTDLDKNTHVVEYRAGDSSYSRQLLFVPQVFPNHKGGQLEFDARGRLYVGMGDGGTDPANPVLNDPNNRSQDLSVDLGKLLRTDPSRPAPSWQIVAYGLRNPWRFSFDPVNGNLWIGDVGAGNYEEVDFLPSARLAGLTNFGWSRFEGPRVYNPKVKLRGKGKLVFPTYVYPHGTSSCAIIGGYVYRGPIASLRGRYFFGDLCTGFVWDFKVGPNGRVGAVNRFSQIADLVSFGEDANRNLYAVSMDGGVYELR